MTRKLRSGLIIAGSVLFLGMAFVWFQLFRGGIDYPRDTVARAELLSLETQLDFYKQTNGFYPTTAQGLEALVTRPQSSPIPEHWFQHYFNLNVDPWHHPYVYRFPNPKDPNTFDLLSLGPDGVESDDDVRERR
jgi:general secretion pathway protein G